MSGDTLTLTFTDGSGLEVETELAPRITPASTTRSTTPVPSPPLARKAPLELEPLGAMDFKRDFTPLTDLTWPA